MLLRSYFLLKIYKYSQKILVFTIIFSWLLLGWPKVQITPFFPTKIKDVNATRVTIDSTVSTTAAEHNGASPTIVFTSDQVGYTFYVDSDGRGKYSKTTDGGQNWNTAVIFDNQTDVAGIAVMNSCI